MLKSSLSFLHSDDRKDNEIVFRCSEVGEEAGIMTTARILDWGYTTERTLVSKDLQE
jgi:hypothetical protein